MSTAFEPLQGFGFSVAGRFERLAAGWNNDKCQMVQVTSRCDSAGTHLQTAVPRGAPAGKKYVNGGGGKNRRVGYDCAPRAIAAETKGKIGGRKLLSRCRQ